MNKIFKIIFLTLIGFIFVSCGSTPVAEKEVISPITDDSVESVETNEVVTVEETQTVLPEVDDEEYERSTKKLAGNGESVTKDELAADKAEIFRIIDELKVVMAERDFDSWIKYIAPESLEYYSVPRKIKRGQKIEVNNGLEPYFMNIFTPSREKSTVKEIRYESKNLVRVVGIFQNRFTTYYNFVKINGKWYVKLPTDIVVK